MKTLHFFTSLLLFAFVAFVAINHNVVAAGAILLVGSSALTPWKLSSMVCEVTLTPAILLQQTMAQLYVRCRSLQFFSHEFTSERLKKDQKVTGKIRIRPTVAQYDANNGGYKAGAQNARDLLVDVPFVMDQHIHVTVKLTHLHALADSINALEGHFADSASVIGKHVNENVLSKIRSGNFTHGDTYTTANSDKDALNAIRKSMNIRGVPDQRFGIVNSDVFETLAGDSRITNRNDDRSKDTDGEALGHLQNISGFKDIVEQPDLTTGNTTPVAVTGVAATDVFTAAAHGFKVGDRVRFPAPLTGGTGLTADSVYYYVESVPSVDTFKISGTRGGAVVNFTTDVTAGTVQRADNITGFFATREAIAIKTALPTDSLDLAKSMGIPTPVSADVITDPDSGLSMICYKWFETGTMDCYFTLAALFGSSAGFELDEQSYLMEPCGHILRSA